MAYDNTVQAGRSTLVRYQFRIPPAQRDRSPLPARVNYRHLRQTYLNNIFGEDHPAYPVVELASRTRTLNLGDNAPRTRSPTTIPTGCAGIIWESPIWTSFSMRMPWRRSAKSSGCAPITRDGYTNVALTNMLWEKYGSARI